MADKNFDKERMTDEELDKVLGGFALPIIPDEFKDYFSRSQTDNVSSRSTGQQNFSADKFARKN